jgi:hypothetical protein
VGLLGRVISSSQGLYLNTGQHKHRINTYTHQTSMPCVGFEPTISAFERSTPWRHIGEWRYSSTILDLGTRWRWVVSLTPLPALKWSALKQRASQSLSFQQKLPPSNIPYCPCSKTRSQKNFISQSDEFLPLKHQRHFWQFLVYNKLSVVIGPTSFCFTACLSCLTSYRCLYNS